MLTFVRPACSAVTNFNISEYAGEDLGALGAGALEHGAAAGGMQHDEGALHALQPGGAADAMSFDDFLSGHLPLGAHPMDGVQAGPMMARAGELMQADDDDCVMMPAAMATHDFAAFATGGAGAWGFGL